MKKYSLHNWGRGNYVLEVQYYHKNEFNPYKIEHYDVDVERECKNYVFESNSSTCRPFGRGKRKSASIVPVMNLKVKRITGKERPTEFHDENIRWGYNLLTSENKKFTEYGKRIFCCDVGLSNFRKMKQKIRNSSYNIVQREY